MVEKWRTELIKLAEIVRRGAVDRLTRQLNENIANVNKAYVLKQQIIENLRAEPDSIFGDTNIFIQTENHLLVHDVAKTLNIRLERNAEVDGFNFRGKVGDILVSVYGMKEIPHCKIVPHKKMVEQTTYETVCNGVGESLGDPNIKRVAPK
jgi:hypothetical protein